MAVKNFPNYIAYVISTNGAGSTELIKRVEPSAASIDTLHKLMRWARERFPDQHDPNTWRHPLPPSLAPYGATAMREMWADYLRWKEEGEAE